MIPEKTFLQKQVQKKTKQMYPNKFSNVDLLLNRNRFISLCMHSMVHGVEKGGGQGLGLQSLELHQADMDQGFWNDTYSYGGWDWGRSVLWIVFGARAACTHTQDTKGEAHTHTHTQL